MRLPLVLLAFLQPAAALVVSRAKLPRLACRGGAEGSEDAGSSPLYPALDAHETGSIKVGIHEVAYAISATRKVPQHSSCMAGRAAERCRITRGILTPTTTASF